MAAVHVVYGIIEDPRTALAAQRTTHPRGPALGPMSATLDVGIPVFRLNSPGWINWSPESVAALSDTDALFTYCRERLLSRATVFSLSIRTFINACFDFAESEVERRREELERRIDDAGLPRSLGFPHYRDWIFSALLPLPNVFIAVDDKTDDESFVRVDALFWDGTSALAVMLEGRSMPTPRALQSLERLQAAHPMLSVVRIPWSPRADAPNRDNLPTAYLGRFLDDVSLPFGPYRVLSSPTAKQSPHPSASPREG